MVVGTESVCSVGVQRGCCCRGQVASRREPWERDLRRATPLHSARLAIVRASQDSGPFVMLSSLKTCKMRIQLCIKPSVHKPINLKIFSSHPIHPLSCCSLGIPRPRDSARRDVVSRVHLEWLPCSHAMPKELTWKQKHRTTWISARDEQGKTMLIVTYLKAKSS
jgi:hypothetical protein